MFTPGGKADEWGTEAMARERAMKAVHFLIENGAKGFEYRGMYEDVVGPPDSIIPSVACLALCKTYDHTRDAGYLQWAQHAIEIAASMIRHDPDPFVQVESLACFFNGTSSDFMLSLAGAELNNRSPAYNWEKLATACSYLATTQKRDESDPMYGALAWQGNLVNPEWQECQMVWVSHRVVAARASRHPKIKIGEDLRGEAFGERITHVSLDLPGLECSPEVDYGVLHGESHDYLVLLPDPDVPGTAKFAGEGLVDADSGAPVGAGKPIKVDHTIVLRLPRAK
jgi:hypothetical protein